MPALLHYLPNPSLNGIATKVLTARSTASTSASHISSGISSGNISIIIMFGIFGAALFCSMCTFTAGSGFFYILLAPFMLPWFLFKGIIWLNNKFWEATIGRLEKRRKLKAQAKRLAQNNRNNELSNRGNVRKKWAQEELQLARKERRAPNLPRNLIGEFERSKSNGRFHFEELPAEIRLMVYVYLDYGAALELMRVSKYFYRDKPASGIDKEQRATFVYHAETFQRNRTSLACFGCLRVKERVAFEEERRTGEFERFAERELERRCFDCQIQGGEVKWPRWRTFVRCMRPNLKWTLRRMGRP